MRERLPLPPHLQPDGYYSFSRYLNGTFGEKVHKIPLALGLPCPNKDGTLSTEGCIFCDAFGSGPIRTSHLPLLDQLHEGMARIGKKHHAGKFIAYFQANTATAASAGFLAEIFDRVLSFPGIVGISLGTRPDCIGPEHLQLIQTLHCRTHLWVELGLQSIFPQSLVFLRRHHDLAQFRLAFDELKRRGIRVCVHVILGIPGEGEPEATATAEYLSAIGVDGVKIHPLLVLKGTDLETLYREKRFFPPEIDDYVRSIVRFLEHLSTNIVIQRLTGEREKELFVAPAWAQNKGKVLRMIAEKLKAEGTFQGKMRPASFS